MLSSPNLIRLHPQFRAPHAADLTLAVQLYSSPALCSAKHPVCFTSAGRWVLWLLFSWSNKERLLWTQGVSFPPFLLWGQIACPCKVHAPLCCLLYTSLSHFQCQWPFSFYPTLQPEAGHNCTAVIPGFSYWASFGFLFTLPVPLKWTLCKETLLIWVLHPFLGDPGINLSYLSPGVIFSSCFGTLLDLFKLSTHIAMFSYSFKIIITLLIFFLSLLLDQKTWVFLFFSYLF